MPLTPAQGFGPVFSPDSRVLILGSYPSPASFAQGFYYGNAKNRFWRLAAALTGQPVPNSTEEKRALILRGGLALWDVLEHCTVTGAADASIKNPVPNDVAALVRRTNVRAIFCNGAAAYTYYCRFSQAAVGLAAVRLPSTSPANAACSFERLLAAWAPLAGALNGHS